MGLFSELPENNPEVPPALICADDLTPYAKYLTLPKFCRLRHVRIRLYVAESDH